MADVLIAGAGPAGSTAALVLARDGRDVTIVERAAFPRTKICGEYLSPGSVGLLHDLGVAGELAPQAYRIDGIRMYGNGVRLELPFSEPGWAIPRIVLDDVLLKAAVKSGVTLVRRRAEDFRLRDDGVAFSVRDEAGDIAELFGTFAIAADGTQSILAQKAGLSLTPRERRFAIGGHFRDFSGLDRYVEMYVDGKSYFAINPLSANRANVMLIVPESELALRREDIDSFVRERAAQLSGMDRFSGAVLEGKRLAVGPLAHAMRATSKERLLFAGDAAGYIDPFTGQGVCFALLSAQYAAVAIDESLTWMKATTSGWKATFPLYDAVIGEELAERKRVAGLVRMLVRSSFLARRAARKLQAHPALAQPLLDAVTGGMERPVIRLSSLAKLVI